MRGSVLLLRLVLLPIAACSFDPARVGGDSPGGDGSTNGDDASDSDGALGPLDVAHVGPTDEAMLASTADIVIGANTTFDTTTGLATPAIAGGVVLADQEGGGRALAIIHARRIEIAAGVTLRAQGDRALVLVASEEIVITGVIDVSATGLAAGAGGYPSRSGPGAGVNATGINGFDTGASGAGHGAPGGSGGNESSMPITGPAPGAAVNTAELPLLDGGSGGGRSTPIPCGDGGAGGGAIQLTAPRIAIEGVVDAGGGGGQGGNECVINGVSDASGGSGGGAGGAIYVQSRDVSGTGWLVANGGGGGGGGCRTCTDRSGDDGADGARDDTPAPGGVSPLDGGTGQCHGGAGASTATAVAGNAGTNAGGGGGGPGRIFVTTTTLAPSVRSSPTLAR